MSADLMKIKDKPVWDTHFHILAADFPVVATAMLPNQDACVETYRSIVMNFGFTHGVVVQPSIYGTDNTLVLKALEQLGGDYRASCVINGPIEKSILLKWHKAGIRGVRFNQVQFGTTRMEDMHDTAKLIADLGWHIELHISAEKLADYYPFLKNLPTRLVLDHLARCTPETPSLVDDVLRLYEHNHVWIKISGPYHEGNGPPDYMHSLKIAKRFIKANPDRLVWGSDWPHVTEREKPDYSDMVRFLELAAGNQETLLKLVSDGPGLLYG